MKENPSKTSGSMAEMMVGSTGERRQGSLVNSGSKLLTDFFPRCEGRRKNMILKQYIQSDVEKQS